MNSFNQLLTFVLGSCTRYLPNSRAHRRHLDTTCELQIHGGGVRRALIIHQTTTTLRSISPTSSDHEDKEEASGIIRSRLDADEARTHFLTTEERDHNFSSRISSKRK